MKPLIPAILRLAGALPRRLWRRRPATAQPQPEPAHPAYTFVSTGRGDVDQWLSDLARNGRSGQRPVAPICHVPRQGHARLKYVCPLCGATTYYAADMAQTLQAEIPACRALTQKIQGVWVELDESRFCRRCSPRAGMPRLGLSVRYDSEGEPHRVRGVTQEDVELILEFTEKRATHRRFDGSEAPMAQYARRLQELLGIQVAPGGRDEGAPIE